MRPGIAIAVGLALLAAGCGRPPQVTLYEDRHGGSAASDDARSSTVVHTVAANESVYDLSQRFGISTRSIIDANGLRPPYRLRVGQKLTLPRPSLYTVARGDTVYGISRQYGVAMSQIVRLNELQPPYTIHVGQRLRLPGAVQTATPTRVVAGGQSSRTSSAVHSEPLARPGPAQPGPSHPTTAPRPPAAPQHASRTPEPSPAPPAVSSKGYVWPVDGKVISGFGSKGKGLHNDGINVAAPRGAAVRAAQSGVVAYAGNELRGFGNLVLIKHSGGVMTAYAHNETLLVKPGQTVSRGEPIARVGSSGSVESPQLHFEIRFGRQAVDPMKFLGTRTASLPG